MDGLLKQVLDVSRYDWSPQLHSATNELSDLYMKWLMASPAGSPMETAIKMSITLLNVFFPGVVVVIDLLFCFDSPSLCETLSFHITHTGDIQNSALTHLGI